MSKVIEKYIWLKNETGIAKIGWMKEAGSGLYFSPRPDFRSVHYSYHTPGIHHLKTSTGYHKQKQVTPLVSLEYWGNVGGFGIELANLQWAKTDEAKEHDILIPIHGHTVVGQYVLVSLNLVVSARVPEFIASRTQEQGPCLAHCASFPSTFFPHLQCVVSFQFQIHASSE